MAILGVDVSSYNKTIDWNKVKQAGFEFAVLKIIRKDLEKDTFFDTNWAKCEEAGVKIYGVYNYSYASTVSKAIGDAKAVVKALNGKKTCVWLDVEDKCQKNLGSVLIDIILMYRDVIIKSGNTFGVYTGESFYNSYIKPYYSRIKGIPMWIARYGTNNGTRNAKYQPQVPDLVSWQYTSKGKVNGISTPVDLDVCYDTSFLPTEKPPVIGTVNPYPEPERILRFKIVNMRGEDVKWVQYYLIEKGFLSKTTPAGKTNCDGVFGKGTTEAVKDFQKSRKIEVDGIVGQDTRNQLKK